jgi:hypothetical protein
MVEYKDQLETVRPLKLPSRYKSCRFFSQRLEKPICAGLLAFDLCGSLPVPVTGHDNCGISVYVKFDVEFFCQVWIFQTLYTCV